MKVLAINGSPKGEKSVTIHILTFLLKGMKKAGADTEVLHLINQKIDHCKGCCFCTANGYCIIKDDMEYLMKKFFAADLVIYGTPLLFFDMSSLLKKFIERTMRMFEYQMVSSKSNQNITILKNRYVNPKKIFLVVNGGLPDFEHFKPLVNLFRHMTENINKIYLGEIIRPTSAVLNIKNFRPKLGRFYSALEKAGTQLITDGKINSNIIEIIQEDWFLNKHHVYAKLFNEDSLLFLLK